VTLNRTPPAVLGPPLAKVSVPETVCPALMFGGKFDVTCKSAIAAPPMTTVTLLLLRLMSATVVTLAVTLELPDAGCK
jgi:hypothetical protein